MPRKHHLSPEQAAAGDAQRTSHLKPIRDSERARELSQKGRDAQRVQQAIRGEFSSKTMTRDDWHELFVKMAFDPRWSGYYYETKQSLLKQYVSDEDERPQYKLLVEHAAQLSTLINWKTSIGEHNQTTSEWRTELRQYIAQLQRYTEAERRIEIVVQTHEIQLMQGITAIAEHVLQPEQREILFAALQRAIEAGGLSDDAAITATMKRLPSPRDELDDLVAAAPKRKAGRPPGSLAKKLSIIDMEPTPGK